MIVTGGWDNPSRVDVYNLSGWFKELPQLIAGSKSHGCGHYVGTDEKMVK